MIYTIVVIDKKVVVHEGTERQLRQTLGSSFEVLEIHKDQQIANQRADVLRNTTYKKRKKNMRGVRKISRLGKKKLSELKKGVNNPRYGKKHSPEALERISKASLGNRKRTGIKSSLKQVERFKAIRRKKKWASCPEGSMWFHHPITGEHKRSVTWIDGWVRGRSEELNELGAYNMSKKRRRRKYIY